MSCLLLASVLLGVPLPVPSGFTVMKVPTASSPKRLAAAPLDADDRVDLFVMQAGSSGFPKLQVFLNQGGSFVPGWTQLWVSDGTEATIFDADLADTDSDGDNDLVYCVGVGVPGQRFNDGAGGFDQLGYVPTASVRFENELIDIDDNGTTDLVYYEPDFFFDSYFGTQVGDGHGNFNWASYTEYYLAADLESHRRIALGDLTGDGLQDAVFTSLITGGIRFFKGTPKPPTGPIPGWAPPQLVYLPPCNDATMADLDGDGRLDLIATAKSSDSIVVFLTTPTGAIGHPHLYPAGDAPDAIVAADFDLDGVPDVMAANPSQGTVQVLRGSGAGGLGPARVLRVGQLPNDIATADFDNDGDLDAVVACADHLTLLFNDALSPDSTVHFNQK